RRPDCGLAVRAIRPLGDPEPASVVAGRAPVAPAQALHLRLVGPHDPTAGWPCLLAGAYPAAPDPALERRERHPNRLRQLRHPPLRGTEAITGLGLAPWGAHAQVPQELLDALSPELLPPFRRAVPLGVEPCGDRLGGQPVA